jgi:hypothetical protein
MHEQAFVLRLFNVLARPEAQEGTESEGRMTIIEAIQCASGKPFARRCWGGNGYWKDVNGKVKGFYRDGAEISNFLPGTEALLGDDWIVLCGAAIQ